MNWSISKVSPCIKSIHGELLGLSKACIPFRELVMEHIMAAGRWMNASIRRWMADCKIGAFSSYSEIGDTYVKSFVERSYRSVIPLSSEEKREFEALPWKCDGNTRSVSPSARHNWSLCHPDGLSNRDPGWRIGSTD